MKQRLPSLPLPSPNYDVIRMYGVLGTMAILFILGAAGTLSGVGIFILMMIQMKVLGVIGSSLLLCTSLAIDLAIYGWVTA